MCAAQRRDGAHSCAATPSRGVKYGLHPLYRCAHAFQSGQLPQKYHIEHSHSVQHKSLLPTTADSVLVSCACTRGGSKSPRQITEASLSGVNRFRSSSLRARAHSVSGLTELKHYAPRVRSRVAKISISILYGTSSTCKIQTKR